MTWARKGPPSGAAPTTAQAERTDRASGGQGRPALDAGPQDPSARDVGEAPAACDGQAHGRPALHGVAEAADEVLDHPLRRRGHERQGEVPLGRGRPAQPVAGVPTGLEEPVEVVDDLGGWIDGDEDTHVGHHARPGGWREGLTPVVTLAA